MNANRGAQRQRIFVRVLCLVLSFSTTGCATLITMGTNQDACMGPDEFGKAYASWMMRGGGDPPTGVSMVLFYALPDALSYAVEHQVCKLSKGQPEPGQPPVPVQTPEPEQGAGEIAGGNEVCADVEGTPGTLTGVDGPEKFGQGCMPDLNP